MAQYLFNVCWIFPVLLMACATGVGPEGDGGALLNEPAMPIANEAACGIDCPPCEDSVALFARCQPGLTPQEQENLLTGCTNDARAWSATFGTQLSGCFQTFDCANIQNVDDICMSNALKAIVTNTLDPTIVASCFQMNSEACLMTVSASPPGVSVSSTCLQKWASCRNDPSSVEDAFTESDCLSISGLTMGAQAAAQQCLIQECNAVGVCLQSAGVWSW